MASKKVIGNFLRSCHKYVASGQNVGCTRVVSRFSWPSATRHWFSTAFSYSLKSDITSMLSLAVWMVLILCTFNVCHGNILHTLRLRHTDKAIHEEVIPPVIVPPPPQLSLSILKYNSIPLPEFQMYAVYWYLKRITTAEEEHQVDWLYIDHSSPIAKAINKDERMLYNIVYHFKRTIPRIPLQVLADMQRAPNKDYLNVDQRIYIKEAERQDRIQVRYETPSETKARHEAKEAIQKRHQRQKRFPCISCFI